ncbi:MAG: hypothetical protein LBJ00_03420 [Planctomycetaceae bacterium]|nr:hypothetical protein [Planctomycetaceae bacterium]
MGTSQNRSFASGSNKAPKGRNHYIQATLKFLKLNTQAQQREAVVQGRSP